MKKCVNLTKYFRSHPHTLCRPPAQGIFNKQLTHSEGAGGGPPPEREGPQRWPLPPFPDGLIIGVCGRLDENEVTKTIFVISQIHIDEIPAVINVRFYADPELQEELKEKRSFLFREEFNNEFRELKAWAVTSHAGWIDLANGMGRLQNVRSYCYVLTREWLETNLSYKTSGSFAFIDESCEARKLLARARAEGLVPLVHWQSRLHVNLGSTITARELYDGYLLDNRQRPCRAPNVVAKCLPSLLDIAKNPRIYKGKNPVADLMLAGKLQLCGLLRC